MVLAALIVVAIALATWRGALWPFDLRFSALIAAGGLAVQTIAWWPAMLAIAMLAALLTQLCWRLALWPLAILGMFGLHAAFGPDLGLATLATLGLGRALHLYAFPTALTILTGSLLREMLLPTTHPSGDAVLPADAADPSGISS